MATTDFVVKNGLVVNEDALIRDTTNSISTTTGALVVSGGVGIANALYVGGTANLQSDLTLTGDLAVNGGDLTTSQTTFNLVNATATTVNFAGAATDVQIGAATGTTEINNNLNVVGDVDIDGGDLTASTATFNLINTNATTLNIGGAATTVSIGAATGTTTINNANTVVTGDLAVNGGDLTTNQTTFNLVNATATTLNIGSAATTARLGANSGTLTLGNPTIVGTQATQNLYNTVATTLNIGGAATTVSLGAATGTTTINNANTVVTGDLAVNGGDITTNQSTFNLLNTTATTVNFAGAATTVEIGAATGTTNINNNLDVDGDVNIDGGDLTVSTATFNLANTTATTVNFAGAATAIDIGAATGTTSINNNLIVDLDVEVRGGDITTNQTTFNLVNATATTLNIGGAATTISIGSSSGTTTVNNNMVVTGNLTVNGTTTSINSTTVNVDDINIVLGDTASPTDLTANGGGITLRGATDKTIIWVDATDRWTFNQGIESSLGVQNTPIGNTVASSGAFTTLTANNAVTFTAGTASTTTTSGTLVVTGGVGVSGAIYAGSIQNTPIGSTTASTGAFTTLTTSSTTTFSPANANVIISPTGTGTVTISPAGGLTINPTTTGTIDNVNIGSTTRGSGAFTTLTSNAATTFTAGTASTTTGTGTLVVTGGIGLSGNLNSGGNGVFAGDVTVTGGDIFTAAGTASTLYSTTTTGNISLANGLTSGTLTIGGASATGTITIDPSTVAHTLNIGTGANASGVTKNINLGTGGAAGSTTNIVLGSSTGGGIITLNNPRLSGGPNGFIRRFDSGYSTTITANTLYEIGRFTMSADSQNISFIGEVRASTGAVNATTRFILNARSNILPAKSFSLTEEQLNLGAVLGIEVWEDTLSGLVVIGYRSTTTFQNIGWSLVVQERGNYNYFTQTNSLTILDTTGLTQVTEVSPGYANNLRLLAGTASTTTGTGTLVVTGGIGLSGDIYAGGVVNGLDINSTSDARLKENVNSLTNSFDILEKINPVSFTWKKDGKKAYGVIAQEIEKVLPEIVNTDGDGMKSVSYMQLIPFLIDVIKQQQQEIDRIKKQINS